MIFLLIFLVGMSVAWYLVRKCKIKVDSYKGAKIIFFRHWNKVWVSHYDGYPKDYFISRWNFFRKKTERVYLLADKEDRDELERKSLEAYKNQLDALVYTPKAVIISASPLNQRTRKPQRLADRVQALEQRQDVWDYKVIEQNFGPIRSVIGRWSFGWPVRTDEGESYCRVIAPGVIAWRKGEQQRIPSIYKRMRLSDRTSP